MEKTIKKLNFAYYSAMLAIVLAALAGYWLLKNGHRVDAQSTTGIVLAYVAIAYTIASIPLALAWFFRQTKKIRNMADEAQKYTCYKRNSLLRLGLIALGVCLSIVCFYLLGEQSMLYCAGMGAVALVFCKPSLAKMQQETEI